MQLLVCHRPVFNTFDPVPMSGGVSRTGEKLFLISTLVVPQCDDNYVKEHVFKDGKCAPGDNFWSTSVPEGASLAAVGWDLDSPHIRVYYQSTVQELVCTNASSFSGAHMDMPLAVMGSQCHKLVK
ncbi:hypothetical protein BT96DRAFT_946168 [Gymnopus androsaceus JB14]|uniref:Fucose-specific lectin n=1 Tax=Gymnopus androsaceus JB14 TaxID=1447944 RepID=A0A6A4GYI4_9AGAR|nr:hypothetical protein BT96DRAFT_946168 [Gymnopus androsaceus JB14]